MGKRVGMIERKPRIGGAGLQTGTIPSKALREVAYMASQLGRKGMREAFSRESSSKHGLLYEAITRKDMVIAQQESVILHQLMTSGVSLIPGEASFLDSNTLEVINKNQEPRHISADVIILATGSRPRRPDNVPFDKKMILDSTSILKQRHLPRSLLVMGGGVIACEFISIFSALGVEVTVVDSHSQILDYLSKEIVTVLTDVMESMGVAFHLNSKYSSIEKDNGEVCVTLQDGKKLYANSLLFALGRTPNLDLLQLDNANIDTENGWITVNDRFQTSKPHIYAVGDVIGRPALASTGMEQGRMATQHAFQSSSSVHAENMPMAIYTIPEISSVGKTLKELKAEGIDCVVGRGWFKNSARGQIIGDTIGLLKLNVDRKTRKIMGVHIVGESASELIHIGQVLMNMNGTVSDLAKNVFNYPTLAECYKMAATDCLTELCPTCSKDPCENRQN